MEVVVAGVVVEVLEESLVVVGTVVGAGLDVVTTEDEGAGVVPGSDSPVQAAISSSDSRQRRTADKGKHRFRQRGVASHNIAR